MSEVLKALSDPTRREILFALREQDLTAGEIAARFEQTGATISHHLSVLRESDLVRSRRNGTQLIYSASVTVLEDAIASLLALIPVKSNETESNS
ncbi:MAG: transcriptional regulator [Armatimonadetes bacterium Cent15-Ar3]|nr:MAG: transcriptional regulator [Armatimonadetes bacterium Cent15-Ar3]